MPKHLFILDPLSQLNKPIDTSLGIAFALTQLGEETFYAVPQKLYWHNQANTACVHATKLSFKGSHDAAEDGITNKFKLDDFKVIYMRKDPPYDLDYLATTWLLDSVGKKSRVINQPSALRTFNEKLAILGFPEFCQPALVSSDPKELFEFLQNEAQEDAILKPLHLFGGRDVVRINLKELSTVKARQLLDAQTNHGQSWRLIQPFDQAIFSGEVRCFAVGGQPLSWCLKTPAKNQFIATTRAGAKLAIHKPTAREIEIVTTIAQTLKTEGIEFIGFDLIGGFVSEINITSPRLLRAPDDSYDYFHDIASYLLQS